MDNFYEIQPDLTEGNDNPPYYKSEKKSKILLIILVVIAVLVIILIVFVLSKKKKIEPEADKNFFKAEIEKQLSEDSEEMKKLKRDVDRHTKGIVRFGSPIKNEVNAIVEEIEIPPTEDKPVDGE